ncbi:MAG: hypothetical protein H6704_13975 [Myxococcales bacterium]|nr:hypothetical protein [Myxococcales bacterium]
MVVAAFLWPTRAAYAWLFAFACVASVTVGALFALLIFHACGAKWFVPLRRCAEHVVATLPLLVVLAVPLLVATDTLYPWVGDPSGFGHHERSLLRAKAAWLEPTFFRARTLVYLAVFVALAEPLVRWSRRQAAGDATGLARRMTRLGVAGLLVLAVVFSLAAFDWLMSLEPVWFSNVYGVHAFAGGFLAALGLLALQATLDPRVDAALAPSHRHALGRMLLAFVCFWAYIAFVQVMLVWIADQPEEVVWLKHRWSGGWEFVGVALVVLHFALPLGFLLPRATKLRRRWLAFAGAWMLGVHALEVWWLVLPALHPAELVWPGLELAALACVGGATMLFGQWRAAGVPALAEGDPRLEQGLDYRSATP